ncbi:MAG: EAL domain-containing protein [Nitrosomonas sp.]
MVYVIDVAAITSAFVMISGLKDKSHYSYTTFVGCVIFLLAVIGFIAYEKFLERFDFIIYDKLITFQHPKQDSKVAIIAIDDSSLKALGQWPWSRAIHARLVDRLHAIDNQALIFDLLFTESQESDTTSDRLFAESIKRHGHVALPVAPVTESSPYTIELAQPIPLLAEYAKLGHTDVELDSDGVARRVFLYAGVDLPTWPTLSLSLLNNFNAKEPLINAHKTDQTLSNDLHKSWVRSAEVLIPYAAEFPTFHRTSYAQVLFDDATLYSLRDKVIFVGVTATGLGARFSTPLTAIDHQLMTGIDWHANVFSMLSENEMIMPLSNTITTMVSVLGVGIVLLLLIQLKQQLTILLLLLLLALELVLNGMLLKFSYIWMPPSALLLGTLFLYPLRNWQRINHFISMFLINKIRTSAALESIGDGVIITDNCNAIIYVNKGAEKILETQFAHMQGKMLHEVLDFYPTLTHPNVLPLKEKVSLPAIKASKTPEEYRIRTTHGDELTVRIVCNEFYDESNAKMGSVIAMTDITDSIELAQRVAHQKNYDALTELPNRSQLLVHFDRMIKTAENTSKIITVFFITLDNFKKINDAMGHHAGDKLLKMVSSRLFETLQKDDVVGRWGGDEFVLLSNHLSKDTGLELAQRLLEIVRQRFEIDDLEVFVSASIGISYYPENGLTSEIVIKRAATAMYHVKQDGGNQYDCYSAELSAAWTREQITLEKELRTAIKQQELQVLFQPIFNVQSHNISRMEALVRWPHPSRGYLSPSSFIPLAENSNQIESLGEMVLKESCQVAYKLIKLGYPIKVSVNLNPRQLVNRNLPEIVSKILRETDLPAQSLILEMTENAIVNDMGRASRILREIKKLNVTIALDDFGTGYSSLTLLRELPIDILKIDKSFVHKLGENANDLKIVQAIIGLGKKLGLTVIAEGVETEEQVDLLTKHGCFYQQGYYYSRPIPYKAVYQLMQDAHQTLLLKSSL